ncbi:MAG: urea carboxylase [Gammaproteobacteria bacterium]|nr:urea carboxylase [Gammaproteobacteria bacterium]
MFEKVLIANRGAIACRIARTLKRMGVGVVAVHTRADADSLHVTAADEAVCIGEALAAESYLDGGRILEVARATGARAIHPGYGFLSENAAFAEACAAAGVVFIGPTPAQLRDFGLKHTARALAQASGLPLLPGTGLLADVQAALDAAAVIGYPVMLKSTAGGGGIGMQLCRSAEALASAFDSVQRLSRSNFADGGLYLEKFVERARHLEVQLFGDGEGGVLALGERDCSLQRRNQKVIEETPAPGLTADTRAALAEQAVALGESVRYRSAGTVEFVYDTDTGQAYFLEVNTRLQVEHGVTEMVTGVDIVEWMVRLAAGELPPLASLAPTPHGHSIQARIYAEDPAKQFQPAAGLLTEVVLPADARCDTWVADGVEVSPFYDPMLAKVIVHADTREAALARLAAALAASRFSGLETNLDYLRSIVTAPVLREGRQITATLASHPYAARSVDVLAAGTDTTVQDHPGRLGYWEVGVPPSGPMDALAFRLANRLVGNADGAAGLEITVTGPTLRFNCAATIALTGAPLAAELEGAPVPWWTAVDVPAGAVLKLGAVTGAGVRAYLAVRGGFDVPRYMGSRATFTLGRFGGHGGRALRLADVLRIGDETAGPVTNAPLAEHAPVYGDTWTLRVIYGPHGAPDFFTREDIDTLLATDWQVHYNSSRTGVRLIGPKPTWARSDGGEAGLHPSNIHDNAYAIGAVDFTGDMPVILGPDGPSLGGFVCPVTVIAADRWMLGQLKPGDRLRFTPVSQDTARAAADAQETFISELRAPTGDAWPSTLPAEAPIKRYAAPVADDEVVIRPAGDDYVLIEFGPAKLDIGLRFRAQALWQRLKSLALPGIVDLTPGIRSLQVHFDPRRLPQATLLRELDALLGDLDHSLADEVPSRIVHLPLAWDDPSTRLAIDKYMQSVRPDAPWCPSNIEFIRRINGLADEQAVKDIVFGASYLVMGLGDVYLGAPVATPLDPRHRLVTTKYNPARTWTPENAVGIGGSYLCIYGMEGPGGYQFVGRTLQMWNRYRSTQAFTQPWLLRFFDQIRFFPVSAEELVQLREDFPRGRYDLRIEETRFSLSRYQAFLAEHRDGIAAFKATQQAAFEAERARWAAAGQDLVADDGHAIELDADEAALTAGERAASTHVHGSVWQVLVEPGARVAAGDTLMVVESMKMEIAVVAEHAGTVARVLCRPGAHVAPGQTLLVLAD